MPRHGPSTPRHDHELRTALEQHRLRQRALDPQVPATAPAVLELERQLALADKPRHYEAQKSHAPAPPSAGERVYSPRELWVQAMRTGRTRAPQVLEMCKASNQRLWQVLAQLQAAGIQVNGHFTINTLVRDHPTGGTTSEEIVSAS